MSEKLKQLIANNTLSVRQAKTIEELAEIEETLFKNVESLFSLQAVGCSFLKQLIDKEVVLKNKLQENLDIYLKIKNMVEYDKTFSQWNKCNLVLWDLKDALYRFGVEID
tara:strand:+ start:363 stop:692 length:330 start_codon:yes stop_codon:yes gene_type:complete